MSPGAASKALSRVQDRRLRRRLRSERFTILSDDCWGGQVYQALGVPFQSPLVGLLMGYEHYLRLVEDLPGWLDRPLELVPAAEYPFPEGDPGAPPHTPVGLLGGEIEIRFLHYDSVDEAREKWERRVERIDLDRLFVKFSGDTKPYPTPVEVLERFDRLPFEHKVCFNPVDVPGLDSVVPVPRPTSDGALMFRRCLESFDVVGWLNGAPASTPPARLDRTVARLRNDRQG